MPCKFYFTPPIKLVCWLCLALVLPALVPAQQEEGRLSFGLGLEGNAFSTDALAFGLSLLGEYHVNPFFSAGLSAGVFYDFDSLLTIEPLAFARLYGRSLGSLSMFIEGSAGAALLLFDGDWNPAFSGGLKAGIRFALKDWYIEPAVRGGYPVIVGVSLTAGYALRRKQPAGDSKKVRAIPLEKGESTAAIKAEEPKEEKVSPAEVPVEKLREDIKLDIVIRFRANTIGIDEGELEKLGQIGEKLREYPGQRIRIAGYSAQTGSTNAQLFNSLERAQATADYLVKNGYAESERIDVAGLGAADPIAPNNSPANRAQNDRVEVTILKD
ncbi:hypothetical protein AGMMS49942_14960 [Spirochaetia bacterium]|nr:hypothetical protein AGMMS49942_14960 [Spirochaetia bacterium]